MKFGRTSQGFAVTLIITNSSTPFTFQTFCKWLYDSGYTDGANAIENNNRRYLASGANRTAYIQMISCPNGSDIWAFGDPWCQNHVVISSANYFIDTVQQII